MTQPEWSHGVVTRAVAGEIRRHRDAQGLSAQQLADACAALGVPIPRTVIANLENGRRPMVSVAELIVIARVLRVPPIELVFPIARHGHATFELLPGQEVGTWSAAQWFTGEGWFPAPVNPGAPVRGEDSYLPDDSALEPLLDATVPPSASRYMREQVRLVEHYWSARMRSGRRPDELLPGAGVDEGLSRDELWLRQLEHSIRNLRERMRKDGLDPGVLPEWLAHIEPESER